MVKDFLNFIASSGSAFHAVNALCRDLEAAGYQRLHEQEKWTLTAGGKYYVTRNLSSLIAFEIPEDGFTSFQTVASHSDSPVFKLKPAFEDKVGDSYIRLNVEKYGGMIVSTWLDRPLGIAGRVIVKTKGGFKPVLVDLDRDAAVIPNMCIHFNREINDGYKYNPQTDMMALYGNGEAAGGLMREIAEKAGVRAEDIVSHDLYLYSRTPGIEFGPDGEFIACGRIDDLECAYTSVAAFIGAKASRHVNMCCVFDNEEVGSCSKQGADSSFLENIQARVCAAFGMTGEDTRAAMMSGMMVSADNAHAFHPAHPEKYDAQNRVYMNKGVVIKSSANQKYTSDAVSSAVFAGICATAGVPVQYFANRSDIIGGGTLGNISNSHVSLNTVDIGLAQLAMHSSYETAGAKDLEYMVNALKAFYNTHIVMEADAYMRVE